MRGLEEGFQSGDGEERRRKKKKKVRVKEGPMDGEGNAAVASSRGNSRDSTEVGLGLTSEDNDEKKREKKKEKKKRRDLEANDGSRGTTESEGAKFAVANDEKQEEKKSKKKERRKHGANTGNKDCVPSAKKGKQGVKADKNEQDLKGAGELPEAGEYEEKKKKKMKKDKVSKVGETLASFDSGVLKSVSGNPEGRPDVGLELKLEEDSVQHGDEKSLKETKVKRKKRERSSEDAELQNERITECHTTKILKDIAKDERIAEEDSSHGLKDGKRRKKNFTEVHSLSSGQANEKRKKKKARDKLTEFGDPELSNMSKRGFGTRNKPTVTTEETAGDDSCRMQSSSVSGDEKKTRNKKKTKDGRAEGMSVSAERMEITDKNKKTRNARKRSTRSADERTSCVENLDVSHTSTTTEMRKKAKKVKFSGHVEVFPTTDDAKSNDQANKTRLVQGKRFSKEEDEMVKQAVFDYIEEKHLGEDGLDMVLKCKSHRQIKDCWKEIGAALPWRQPKSIYWRAHTLFQRSEIRKWEPEELDLVRRYYNEHGPKWKEMAELLGKHRVHVKDTWRRIKLTNQKAGHWSQEEYQALFDLVNVDLQLKAFEEKKTKHGMLRENIAWTAISRKLDTRHEASCCRKWYKQLTSSMVTQGLWADTDDYLLIDALLKLDSSCIEDVEWDSLLEHRSGDICLRRWKQMARHIGGHRERSFMEQVELLATRYCPNMMEYRARATQRCGGGSDDDDDEEN